MDFVNLIKLRSVKIFGTRDLRVDISRSEDIEIVDVPERLMLGDHPKLRELTTNGNYSSVDFTKLPLLEKLSYVTDGRTSLDFSSNIALKDVNLGNPLRVNLSISACLNLERLVVYGAGDWTQNHIDLRNNTKLKKCVLVGSKLSTICVHSLTEIDFTNWQKDRSAQYVLCN